MFPVCPPRMRSSLRVAPETMRGGGSTMCRNERRAGRTRGSLKARMDALRHFVEPLFFLETDRLDHLSGLAYWRQLTFLLFAIPFVFVSPPILLYGAFRFFLEGMFLQGLLESLLCVSTIVLVTYRHMSVKRRSMVLMWLLYGLGLLLLIAAGPYGAGFACVIGVMALAGCMFPMRDVIRIVLWNVGVLLLLTVLYAAGLFDRTRMVHYGSAWYINLLVGLVFSSGLPFQIQIIYNGLEAQFHESSRAREQAEVSRVLAEQAREQAERAREQESQARAQEVHARSLVEKALEETEIARRQAEAASAAKSQFLSNMAHEIRTPMNGVIGMIQLMELTELDAEQQAYIKLFRTSADALLGIINDILDHSRIESGRLHLEFEPFAVGEMLEDIRRLFAPAFESKAIRLSVGFDPDVPMQLVGDRFRIRQILMNLVGNAFKFTESGAVTLLVHRRYPVDERGVTLAFEVSDTGIGIPREEQERIFDSFHQVDNSSTRRYGGTGLGLAISRGIAVQMGGTLQVDSLVGKGSTFRFTCSFQVPPQV